MSSVLSNLQNLTNQASSDTDDDYDEEEVMPTKRRAARRSVVMESDSEEDDENLNIVMESSDDEEYSDDDDDDSRNKSLTMAEVMQQQQQQRQVAQLPKKKNTSRAPPKQRRRRRSSARFLRLSGRFDDAMEEEENRDDLQAKEQLGEEYRRALRLNAENRINSSNSWGLRLIENIDKFLGGDGADKEHAEDAAITTDATTGETHVNFTKASCIVDASAKIYSYRVDDVHLTSYKVLANLNRTDKDKSSRGKNTSNNNDNEGDDVEAPEENGERSRPQRSRSTPNADTLESNLANINMNKLDSAYDVDPLFHKMSKTFDEGGAKGLLLVNLGVGSDGCGIVFDSKEEEEESNDEEETVQEEKDVPNSNRYVEEGMIDISSLRTTLMNSLGASTMESLSLVPQLASLREEYEALDAEGFVDNNTVKRSRRYATPQEEEDEAEISIHQEALERSRRSVNARASLSMRLSSSSDGDQYAPDDFGGGDDDHGGDDDDYAFDNFVAMDDNAVRYSSGSFAAGNFDDDIPPGPTDDGPNNTTVLLDALLSGDALTQNGDYEYFDKKKLEKMTGGNMWAGSAHWKKNQTTQVRKKAKGTSETAKKKSRSKGKKADDKNQSFVDLSCIPSLDEILKKPAAKKAKRGSRAVVDPLSFPKATKTKHSNTDNLLPPDACIGIEQLSKLFLRPSATVSMENESNEQEDRVKSVGFSDDTQFGAMGFDDGVDDDSYGNDNDGPGFEFADPGDNSQDDDYLVGELEGVRKVEKIKVGYATVAKKVDVKRLKRDLWGEIESAIVPPELQMDESTEQPLQNKEGEDAVKETDESKDSNDVKCLSFKETVRHLDSSQSQTGVTVPFYFICLLHLANEKGLRLDSSSLDDFAIHYDDGTGPLSVDPVVAPRREKRKAAKATASPSYVEMSEGESGDEEELESDSDSER